MTFFLDYSEWMTCNNGAPTADQFELLGSRSAKLVSRLTLNFMGARGDDVSLPCEFPEGKIHEKMPALRKVRTILSFPLPIGGGNCDFFARFSLCTKPTPKFQLNLYCQSSCCPFVPTRGTGRIVYDCGTSVKDCDDEKTPPNFNKKLKMVSTVV